MNCWPCSTRSDGPPTRRTRNGSKRRSPHRCRWSPRAAGRLVGLARIVGDGLTIAYLQDLLVAPEHQRAGVGSELFRLAFLPYDEVRQKVLITDDEPRQLAFYRSMGFSEIRDLEHPTRAFVRFG